MKETGTVSNCDHTSYGIDSMLPVLLLRSSELESFFKLLFLSLLGESLVKALDRVVMADFFSSLVNNGSGR